MKNILGALCLISFSLLYGCEKDKPDPVTETSTFSTTQSGGVLITNEGRYGQSDASVSYLPPAGQVFNDVYTTANQSVLGDILNSIALCNDKLYLVVNNSSKIEVCNRTTLKRIKTINSLPSPRFMLQTGSQKAYVTDLSANRIHIIDLSIDSVIGSISMSGWTEEMILLNGSVYVTNYNSDKIYVIDPVSDMITDSISAARYGNFIISDSSNKLWLLCTGNFNDQPAELLRIDPATRQTEFRHSFSMNEYPSELRKSPSGDHIYFINSAVYRMNANDTVFPSQPFIPNQSRYLYGMQIDASGRIYVSDALNFVQKGRAYIYDVNGNQLSNFGVGIGPGDFLFLP